MLRFADLFTSLLAGLAAAHPSAARDCRPVFELPPGVRVPDPAGCKPRPPHPGPSVKRGPARAAPAPGFIDLGTGTQVRIGGEVSVETQNRR